MIKKAVVAAFVFLLKVVAENYLPGFPITEELLNSVVLAILALIGVDIVELAAHKVVASLEARGLWK